MQSTSTKSCPVEKYIPWLSKLGKFYSFTPFWRFTWWINVSETLRKLSLSKETSLKLLSSVSVTSTSWLSLLPSHCCKNLVSVWHGTFMVCLYLFFFLQRSFNTLPLTRHPPPPIKDTRTMVLSQSISPYYLALTETWGLSLLHFWGREFQKLPQVSLYKKNFVSSLPPLFWEPISTYSLYSESPESQAISSCSGTT